jgi:hypothetical protein
MDAPKGRYRVEEKGGRLVVIDTFTGAPASPVTPPTAPRPTPGRPPDASARRPGLFDLYGRLLLRLVVNRWEPDGRAIVAWEWEQNGRAQRWDAALGSAEQRRLGRALAAISAFPLFVLLSIFAGPVFWLLLPFALPATFWGVWAVMRLQRESGSSGRR